jgi:uncharacterized membrane protein YqjE
VNRRLTNREVLPFAVLLILVLFLTDLAEDWFGDLAVMAGFLLLGALGLVWLGYRRRRNDVAA